MFTKEAAVKVAGIINSHLTVHSATLMEIAVHAVGLETGDIADLIQTQVNRGYMSQPDEATLSAITEEIDAQVIGDRMIAEDAETVIYEYEDDC